MTDPVLKTRLDAAHAAVDDRLRRFPDHPFFLFALREITRIGDRVAAGIDFDRAFYDSLAIGSMCARELEAVDMPFCDTVYALLEAIRPGGGEAGKP